jgi:hypothetical protein
MDLESGFTLLNLLVLPAWILLFAAPRWKWTQTLCGVVTPGLLGLVYAGLLLAGQFRPAAADVGSMMTLSGVQALFRDPLTVLAGWVHYLAFDLLTGAWESRDADRLGLPRRLVGVCLFLTLMVGPLGLLGYLGLRLASGGTLRLEPDAAVGVEAP